MESYICFDLIKFVISDYVDYYNLIQIPILKLNKHRIISKILTDNPKKLIFDLTFKLVDIGYLEYHRDKVKYKNLEYTKVDNLHFITANITTTDNDFDIITISNLYTKKYNTYTIKSFYDKFYKYKSIPNGITKILIIYSNKFRNESYKIDNNYKMVGKYIEWYPIKNNSISAIYTILNFKNDTQDGLQIKYHHNKVKKAEYTMKNGINDGLYQEWDDKGKIIKSDFYVNGLIKNEKII
jgi:antitoxin component YwqK of YwqJK toxin-antitoxin module